MITAAKVSCQNDQSLILFIYFSLLSKSGLYPHPLSACSSLGIMHTICFANRFQVLLCILHCSRSSASYTKEDSVSFHQWICWSNFNFTKFWINSFPSSWVSLLVNAAVYACVLNVICKACQFTPNDRVQSFVWVV